MSDSSCLWSLRFGSPLFLSILSFITTMRQCFPLWQRESQRAHWVSGGHPFESLHCHPAIARADQQGSEQNTILSQKSAERYMLRVIFITIHRLNWSFLHHSADSVIGTNHLCSALQRLPLLPVLPYRQFAQPPAATIHPLLFVIRGHKCWTQSDYGIILWSQ